MFLFTGYAFLTGELSWPACKDLLRVSVIIGEIEEAAEEAGATMAPGQTPSESGGL